MNHGFVDDFKSIQVLNKSVSFDVRLDKESDLYLFRQQNNILQIFFRLFQIQSRFFFNGSQIVKSSENRRKL